MNKASVVVADTKCSCCGRVLDARTQAVVDRDPAFYRGVTLGACCQGFKGADNSGWYDAPEHGYDY